MDATQALFCFFEEKQKIVDLSRIRSHIITEKGERADHWTIITTFRLFLDSNISR